jgi:hypothetical protein
MADSFTVAPRPTEQAACHESRKEWRATPDDREDNFPVGWKIPQRT